jgi:hypothetical protein
MDEVAALTAIRLRGEWLQHLPRAYRASSQIAAAAVANDPAAIRFVRGPLVHDSQVCEPRKGGEERGRGGGVSDARERGFAECKEDLSRWIHMASLPLMIASCGRQQLRASGTSCSF